MADKHLKPKYEAPRIISLEEIGSSFGGIPDPECIGGSNAFSCTSGSGVAPGSSCSPGSTD